MCVCKCAKRCADLKAFSWILKGISRWQDCFGCWGEQSSAADHYAKYRVGIGRRESPTFAPPLPHFLMAQVTELADGDENPSGLHRCIVAGGVEECSLQPCSRDKTHLWWVGHCGDCCFVFFTKFKSLKSERMLLLYVIVYNDKCLKAKQCIYTSTSIHIAL